MPKSGSKGSPAGASGDLYKDFVGHLKTQKNPLPPQEANIVAAKKLKQGGYMNGSGGLTSKGKARQDMGASARAKLRAKTR